jgi:4-amino-4-deoxy-L-arabinose transferase-like glycosyltransferase
MQNLPASIRTTSVNGLALILLAGLCLFSFSYQLGEVPPYHTDENFYILSAKNMLQSGDYLTPMFHEKKRFAKPILFYWLVAASYKTFGVNLVSARLWSVVFGTLSVGLVFLIGRSLLTSKAALVAAFILPSIYLHFQISRWATTDMTLSFFILGAFYFFIKGFQDESFRRRNFYLFYFAMALGFLTKGPPAILLPGLTIAAFLFVRGDWKMISEMRLLHGLLILLIIDVPWFAAMYFLHGDEFLNHLLGAELRDRVFHQIPFSFYYLGVFVRYYLPWSLFLICSFAVLTTGFKSRLLRFFDRENFAILFFSLWILVPIVVFTIFRIEHSRYMLPACPALALILGHYFTALANSEPGFKRPIFKIPFYLTLLIFFLLTLLTAVGVIAFQSTTSVPFRIMFLPLFLATGAAILIVMFIVRRKIVLIITLAVFQTLSLALIHGDAIPFFTRYPMKKFAQEISHTGNGQEKIGVYRLGSHQARLGALTGQHSKYIFTPEMLHAFLDTDQTVFVVIRESVWKEEFSDLPLIRQSTDTIWKKRRVDKKFIRKLWDGGLNLKKSDLVETILLFTNQRIKGKVIPEKS